MALAFRALTQQGNATGGALTVTKPTGTVDGDIIIVVAYLDTPTADSWSSVGAGFTLLQSIDETVKNFRGSIWWKRANGEPASWTWTPSASVWRVVTALSYSGNSGTGTPIDVNSQAAYAATNANLANAPSVTTTAANDMLVFTSTNWSGGNDSGAVGAATTFRGVFGGQFVADATIASAGATGTTRTNGSAVGNDSWIADHVAILLASSGGGGPTIPLLNTVPNTLIRM